MNTYIAPIGTLKKLNIIFAATCDSVIGIKDCGIHRLPWPPLLKDMDFFKNITSEVSNGNFNFIIVGNTTWKTLPDLFKKDPKRKSIVLSRQQHISQYGEVYVNSFEKAIEYTTCIEHNKIFVIGGSDVYTEAIKSGLPNTTYYTCVNYKLPNFVNYDEIVYLPVTHETLMKYEHKLLETHKSILSDISYNIFQIENLKLESLSAIREFPVQKLVESNKSEDSYIDLVKQIYNYGNTKNTRNGIRKSIYNKYLEFNLQDGFPINTFKRTFFKPILEELLWMIRGSTDVEILKKVKVNIWNKNSSKEYHIANNTGLEENDIGPGYGFQMRHFGAKYINCHTDYTSCGVDQLASIINDLNNNPTSTRMVLCLWNPNDTKQMALPPCHMIYTFSVELYPIPVNNKKGKLNCLLTQRSWDILLGWNHTTAALLTHILANHCNYDVGNLLMCIADAHMYSQHYEDLENINILMNRKGRKYPTLKIINKKEKIESYTYDDFQLLNYEPCPHIFFNMIE